MNIETYGKVWGFFVLIWGGGRESVCDLNYMDKSAFFPNSS